MLTDVSETLIEETRIVFKSVENIVFNVIFFSSIINVPRSLVSMTPCYIYFQPLQ